MEPSKIEILSTRQITTEKWLNLYESTYRKDGKISKWGFASRRRGDGNSVIDAANAVVIVPVLWTPYKGNSPSANLNPELQPAFFEKRLVLIKEFRVPIETYEYHFPAGLLEKGESVDECVKRELKEEAGFDLLKIRRISKRLISSAGMSDESAIMVFADCILGDGKQQLEHSEDIQVIPLSHAELCEWLDKDVLFAAKTWPVLLMYQQMGSLEMK